MKSNSKKTKSENGEMSLTDHLREMRNRIIPVLIVLLVGIVLCFNWADELVSLLTSMGEGYGYHYVYIAPQELLLVYFSISLLGGFIISLPLMCYEIYAFCSPGLKKKEKTFFMLAMIFGFVCFLIGVAFAFFITIPFMLRFLISFSNVTITASISIQEYVSFVLLIFVIFGVIFELPVISVLLTGLGLIKPEWLVKARKVMIVVIFVIAAIITPPDIISQVMVALPIVLLYEISIGCSKFVYKFRKSNDEDNDSVETV